MSYNRELKAEVEVLIGRIREILESYANYNNKSKTKIKADGNMFSGISDNINIVPSDHKGDCHSLLVGVCFENDNLDNRLLEFLDHASLICPIENIELFFLTTKWNSDVTNKHLGYITSLRRTGVEIKFIYITLKDVNEMIV